MPSVVPVQRPDFRSNRSKTASGPKGTAYRHPGRLPFAHVQPHLASVTLILSTFGARISGMLRQPQPRRWPTWRVSPRVPCRSAERMIQSFADETVADLFRERKKGAATSR